MIPENSRPSESLAEQSVELSLSDEDILDAMRHVPGYLDITTADFRILYELAYRHAQERLFGTIRADQFLRPLPPLPQTLPLDQAVMRMAESEAKGLAVVDGTRVLGMLTETDLLRQLGANRFAQLLKGILEGTVQIGSCCRRAKVAEAMSSPAQVIQRDAGFDAMLRAFRSHKGRSMPVVDEQGNYLGLLLRKDFFSACQGEML